LIGVGLVGVGFADFDGFGSAFDRVGVGTPAAAQKSATRLAPPAAATRSRWGVALWK
jgi:hypothetical protein